MHPTGPSTSQGKYIGRIYIHCIDVQKEFSYLTKEEHFLHSSRTTTLILASDSKVQGFLTVVCVLFFFFNISSVLIIFILCILPAYACVRTLDPLELELQRVVSCRAGAGWELNPGSFERAASALNHRTTSPAYCVLLNQTNDISKQVIYCEPIHHRGREQLFKVSLQK